MSTIPPSLAEILKRQPFAVLDGGLATELERRGLDLNDPLWSARALLEAPAAIRATHLEYLRAGADIITTASYQATVPGLSRAGLSAAAAGRTIGSSVTLAREARDAFLTERREARQPVVAGSVGPYGAALGDGSEYRGDYSLSAREFKAFHRDRIEILLDAGADLLALETIPSLREADALVDLLESRGSAAAWISFTADSAKTISDGTLFRDAALAVSSAKAIVAVGINCTPIHLISPLLEGAESPIPFIVYPNAGGSYDATTKTWSGGEAAAVERYAERWHALGARIIGGCCRTGPETTAALRRLLGPNDDEAAS